MNFEIHKHTGLRRYSLCLGALPLLYPAAPPSVFAFGKYTAPAVALEREYVVEIDTIGEGNGYSLQS